MDTFYWALVVLAAGLCVIVVELFVPSAGVLGILATILILSSIVLGFMSGFESGALVMLIAVLAVPAVLAMMLKVWPHTPLGKLILLKDIKPEDVLPNSAYYRRTDGMVGSLGVAITRMLPSGMVLINDEKFDAISEGFAIDENDPVKVIAVRENRIYVEPYDGSVEDATDLPVRDRDIFSRSIEELGIDGLDDPIEEQDRLS